MKYIRDDHTMKQNEAYTEQTLNNILPKVAKAFKQQ